MGTGPKSVSAAAACVIAAVSLYFFHFASAGLLADFTHDDLMNLTKSWQAPVWRLAAESVLCFLPSETFRPTASLFYRVMFETFGFNPLPYRIACFALMTANLVLGMRLALQLTGSLPCAALTALLFAYHGEFWPLYMSTGFCYDLLCFFFYALALLWGLRGGSLPLWCFLYALSLGSKEMAVSLPVILLLYEWLRDPPKRWTWFLQQGRTAMVGGLITIGFLAGRMRGAGALSSVEAYRPKIALDVYLEHAAHWLREALYHPRLAPFAIAVALLLVTPLLIRARTVCLAFLWMAVGVLPIAFIPQRGIAQAYISAYALALLVAASLDHLLGNRPLLRAGSMYAVFPALLFAAHSVYGALDFPARNAEGERIRESYRQLAELRPDFPSGAHVLIAEDPFPVNEWASTFLVYLYSQRQDLRISRLRDGVPPEKVDVVLSWEEGRARLRVPRALDGATAPKGRRD